ncbi:MAG: PSD1 domain-containing protein [Planctomycetales bacterium]|nr:PSD1 domain-containing protein [Planctomycetales bacterium]
MPRARSDVPVRTGLQLILVVVTSCLLVSMAAAQEAADAAKAKPDATVGSLNFEDDIVPILQVRCFKCHGAETRKAGLDLRRRFTMLKGGDGGAAIEPGKPDESLLVEQIEKKEMPPPEEEALDKKQIDVLRRWVAAGAPTKAAKEEPLEVADADDTVRDEDRQYWAFQPPARPVVPSVKSVDRVRTPVDSFVLAKLESQGLTFNPDAPPRVLLRRITFDLIGLPPTPEQLDKFLADTRPDAYERVVDELLASPQYGERWARHWLDVAGYADSDGYLEADRPRPEAWRYRDYVIRSLNTDKPYDQFVREQIAGDELTDWRRGDELTPQAADQLIATGFLRTASDPTYPGYKEQPEIHKVLADTAQIVGSTFFGLTIQCARCHAHKSEPFSQRDYYQLQAIFAPALDTTRWLASSERFIPLATESQQAQIKQHNERVASRVAELTKELTELTQRHRGKLIDEKLAAAWSDKAATIDQPTKDKIRAALLVEPAKRSADQKKLIADHGLKIEVTDAELAARFPEFKPYADKLQAALAAETALTKKIIELRGLADLDDKPNPTHVLRRGDFNNKGRTVDPDVPAVLAPANFKLQPQPVYKATGRRRAFAEWLVDARNPTTSRVQVNRLWAHHFGRGLVETVDDFGHTGKPPSHPELLDWLATEFIARGWSQKALHRLIVTSTAYRQSSALDGAKAAVDPENINLWSFRPQRHTGEVVRDTVLATAGKLYPQLFGSPVPVSAGGDGSIGTPDDPVSNRRSVYLLVKRSQPLTLLDAFDTPRMEINCTKRTEAIVATQALTLLNSPFMEANAKAVAERIVAATADRDGRIAFAYRLLFTREPSPAERQNIAEFLDGFVKLQLGDKFSSATADERQAAERLAWPHVSLTLLNTNEFLFVD